MTAVPANVQVADDGGVRIVTIDRRGIFRLPMRSSAIAERLRTGTGG